LRHVSFFAHPAGEKLAHSHFTVKASELHPLSQFTGVPANISSNGETIPAQLRNQSRENCDLMISGASTHGHS
ncbi:MAG: hypothetical protein WBY84_16605, partial [Pseudolabrys sp.]